MATFKPEVSDNNVTAIPIENRPPIFRGLYNESIDQNVGLQREFMQNLKDVFATLPETEKERIKQWKASVPEDADPVKKIKLLQAEVLRSRFNNIDPETKAKVNTFLEKNKALPVDKKIEIASQAMLMPEDFGQKVLPTVDEIAKNVSDNFKARIKENFKAFEVPSLVKPTKDQSVISDKTDATVENMKDAQHLDWAQRVMGNNIKDAMKAQEEAAKSRLEDKGGGFVSALFGAFARSSQIRAAALTGAASLFTKDPELQKKYQRETEVLFDDAVGGSKWLPPKLGIDASDIFLQFWGAKDTDGKYSTVRSVSTDLNPDVQLSTQLFLNLEQQAHAPFGLKVATSVAGEVVNQAVGAARMFDSDKFTKNILWNSAIATAGIGFDVVTDPLNLIGSELFRLGTKLGAPRIAKLSAKSFLANVMHREEAVAALRANTQELTRLANNLKEFPVGAGNWVDVAENYMPGLDDIMATGTNTPAIAGKVPVDIAKDVVTYKDLASKTKPLTEFADRVAKIRAALSKPRLLKPEVESLTTQLDQAAQDYTILTGQNPVKMNEEFQVLVKDGMQVLSKKGQNTLKYLTKERGSTYYSEIERDALETELAIRALSDPSLIDKGGITILGLKIPGTPELFESISSAVKSSKPVALARGLASRFPSVDPWALKRINDAIREEAGTIDVYENIRDGLFKNLTPEQKIRLRFLSEMPESASGYVDNTVRVNNYGTMQDILTTMRGVYNEMYTQARTESGRLLAELQKRGIPEENIVKIMKNGGDMAGTFRENYQPLIYRNIKSWEKFKEKADAMKPIALKRQQQNAPLSVMDRFAISRDFDTAADAIKANLKVDEHVVVDRMIDNIVKGIDIKNSLTKLEELNKKGFDVILDVEQTFQRRAHSFAKAKSRKRLNIDLAQQYGIRDTMQSFYDAESKLVKADSVDFNGLVIPVEVREALQTLDEDSWRVSLLKKHGETQSFEKGSNVWIKLKSLEAIDMVNKWFSKSVTTVWPKHVSKNAASTVFMNFMDIGSEAMNPRLHFQVHQMLTHADNPQVLKNMVFQNKDGLIMRGDQMLGALRENGVFIKFAKTIETEGTKNYLEDFGLFGSVTKGLDKIGAPLKNLNQAFEDQARALNAVANWKRGHSLAESASRSRQFLISYSSLSNFEREVPARLVPFYNFWKENTANVLDTIVRDPKRIIIPGKIVTRAALNGRFQAPPEGVRVYPGSPSAFRREEDGTVTQITSISSHVEDADRFVGFAQDMWGSLSLLNKTDRVEASKRTIKEGSNELFPVWSLPIAVLDTMVHEDYQRIFPSAPMSDSLAKYAVTLPVSLQRMVGLHMYLDDRGEVLAEFSPIANVMFSIMGGGRALSSMRQLDARQGEMMDKVANLILPWSTRQIDSQRAELIHINSLAKSAEWPKQFKKQFKDAVEQYALQGLLLNQIEARKNKK